MNAIAENMTINDVVNRYPETMKVFNRYKVDSCCGGAQSIKNAAELNGVNLSKLLDDLTAAVKKGT
ncbi:MAG: DUF542 domain-containing protein [Nitrospinae bacterium]|nr:DUF542 domain-containing protein [Nitrospinota bacterium]